LKKKNWTKQYKIHNHKKDQINNKIIIKVIIIKEDREEEVIIIKVDREEVIILKITIPIVVVITMMEIINNEK
jgi:hypothetical protein